jgi:RND superfamily putative drug exporter
LRTEPGIAAVTPPAYLGGTAVITVIPTTSPEAAATSDLITRLRQGPIPAAEQGTSLRVYVGGPTAVFGDFATVISHKLPLFLAVIIAFGFLLLLLAFRSLLIPAVAAVMNLLAAGASFGVMVAIFQYGWGLRLLNLGHAGPVESFLPCSCSRSCSACPPTTRSSSSPACTKNGPPPGTTTTRSAPGRPPPAASSPPRPPS